MGMCYSLRCGGDHHLPISAYPAGGDAAELQAAKKENSKSKEKADRKRSQSIDKSLRAEKREYKQTHRLLLLGERGSEPCGEAPLGVCVAAAAGRGSRRREPDSFCLVFHLFLRLSRRDTHTQTLILVPSWPVGLGRLSAPRGRHLFAWSFSPRLSLLCNSVCPSSLLSSFLHHRKRDCHCGKGSFSAFAFSGIDIYITSIIVPLLSTVSACLAN